MSEKQMAISSLVNSAMAGRARQSFGVIGYGVTTKRWFLAGGLVVFVLLLWKMRLDTVAELLWKARWAFPLVFVPYSLVVVCETLGWCFAFPVGRSVPFRTLLRLTVAAKAIQFLTPSIIQAGEFMKVHLLRGSGVTVDVAVASVVIAKTTIMVAELLFIALGLSVTLGYVAIEPAVVFPVTLALLMMALCLMVGLLFQRAGLFRPLIFAGRFIPFLTRVIDRYEGFLSSTDRIIQGQLDEKKSFAWSTAWFFMGWAAGIVEVWMFVKILSVPADVPSVVFILVWSLVVTRLTTFIPGNLGAQEAATVMTFSFLGFSAESAMAFAVLRRLRQLAWMAASFACLTKTSRE
jgi:uncharacterized protein (TIRG00374 family)